MSNPETISNYYDHFQSRLLRDYVYGNIRIESAIAFACSMIGPETERILDIGCGIGASAAGYTNHSKSVRVLGVDISAENIRTATKLFANDRATFLESDVSTVPPGGPFDLVAMIDVYEHIPTDARSQFHASISSAMSEDGLLVLTTPSPSHQKWLSEHQPEGLQIVDEIIDEQEVLKFADDIGGKLSQHRSVDMWTHGQYCYTVIARGTESARRAENALKLTSGKFGPSPISLKTYRRIESFYQRLWDSKEVVARRQRVKDLLGVDVLRSERTQDMSVGQPRKAS